MKYKAVLFDLDGTLIDSKDDIADSVNKTLLYFSFDKLPIKLIYNYIGRGVPYLMSASLKKAVGSEKAKEHMSTAIDYFRKDYKNNLLNKTRCYSGVKELLKELSSIKKAIVTNKPLSFTTPILEGLNISTFFDTIICGDSLEYKKPHPMPLLQALENINVSPQDAIMVGDSFADIDSAHDAKIESCFARYGFGSINSIKPNYSINDINELKSLLF